FLRETGRLTLSRDDLQKAVKLLETLSRGRPTRPEYQDQLARSYTGLGMTYLLMNRLSEAEEVATKVVEIRRRLAADHPRASSSRRLLAESYAGLGSVYHRMGRAADSEKLCQDELRL